MKYTYRLFTIVLLLFTINTAFAQENQTPKDTTSKAQDSSEVFVFVEVMPKYPGGDEARLEYLRDNIVYPKLAKESGIQGTVYVSFVVEADGRITNVIVLKGIGGGCDEEAVRVVKNMPNWEPGTQRGKKVRTQFNMPFRFVLDNGKSSKKLSKKERRKLKKKQKKEAKEKSSSFSPF